MKKPMIPPLDIPKVRFLKNLNNKAPIYKTILSITDAELDSLNKDTLMFEYVINMQMAYKTSKEGITAFKNILRDGAGTQTIEVPSAPVLPVAPDAVRPGIFPRVSKFIKRLKTHPNYTESIGEDLGIVGEEHVVNPLTMKPRLKCVIKSGMPVIIWKKGDASSIDLYVDREMTGNYKFLASDYEPNFIDLHPLPAGVNTAIWRYKGIYRIGDEQVGIISDEISITVTRSL